MGTVTYLPRTPEHRACARCATHRLRALALIEQAHDTGSLDWLAARCEVSIGAMFDALDTGADALSPADLNRLSNSHPRRAA